jgi:hypothetical protein
MTGPSERVWALVSGLPREKRLNRLFLVLQAYLDESESDGTFVLAGYVSRAENWAIFSDEWQRLLDMRSEHYRRLEYFHMVEMKSERDRERCGQFYNIIEQDVLFACGVVVDVRGLHKAIDGYPWPVQIRRDIQHLKNPYHFAFRALIDNLYGFIKKSGFSEKIHIILDDNAMNKEQKRLCAEGWTYWKQTSPKERQELLGDDIRHEDDKEFLPLQAADLLAWWIREWNRQGKLMESLEKLAFPWKIEWPEMPITVGMLDEKWCVEMIESKMLGAKLMRYNQRWRWLC